MIPVQLTIEGLYSYQERQVIDFKNLTDAGLFGIFGSVGSGKSSILEAISFALYGKTERLNTSDKRGYNMMNLKSNRFYIEFDFLNYENKLFRVTRDFRRNSKKFDDVSPHSADIYHDNNGKWVSMEGSDIETIIGLNYANFKRTIIIPQGQFKEFLELKATERTNMMKEIFGLHRYDLYGNASALQTSNTSELDKLEGRLKGFEEITEEKIQGYKTLVTEEKKKFSEADARFQKLAERFQQLKSLKADFENLKQKKEIFTELSAQKQPIDALEKQTELYDQVFRTFSPLIAEEHKLSKEISGQKTEKETQIQILQKTEADFNTVKQQLQALQAQFDQLDQSRMQENDLGLILQMLTYSADITALKDRTAKGKTMVEEVEATMKAIRSSIEKLVKNTEELQLKKLDSALLLNVGNWFSQHKNLRKSFEEQTGTLEKGRREIQLITEELKPFEIDISRYKEDFTVLFTDFEKQKKDLTQKLDHLKIQKELSRFADELHSGEACPLCGSSDHPAIIEVHDVNSGIREILETIEAIDQKTAELQKKETAIEKILNRKAIYEEQVASELKKSELLQKEIDDHLKSFIWTSFDPHQEKDFEEKRTASFAVEKEIEKAGQLILKERETLEKENKSAEKYRNALEGFRLEEVKKQEQINTSLAALKILNWKDYREKTTPEVEDIYRKLSQSNTETEQNYQKLTQQEKELSPRLASQKTVVQQLEKRIAELNLEIASHQQLIENTLQKQNFTSMDEIRPILEQEIHVEDNRKKIHLFRIEFEIVKNGISELETKLKDFSFDENQFSIAEEEFITTQNEVQQINKKIVELTAEIKRLEEEYKKKEELLKALSQLQKRSENLKLMLNLFKGAGFVQYVSSIYLRQLCDHANVRFHKMTRNQLSLQLNENNDFEIIDYLNEGRSRSVKTLSGGQAFQVSLSLALALAESVQSNATADKNFFFIDEGFGTQDTESVNIVFETLMSLQKENRIVGIISHVEELKERIPAALNIVRHDERGSLIEIV
ncbi:MAG: SMC family ATPase [Chryseobacterium sp.]|jgi:exonuclease SbcC|uniref:SMC family ATPase n=1 Tax=Chryseobacterium sp. TaxID=1871047 RepID=UPI0028218E4E|nr:SMC family ATPase [Chryseobacterium sp.]MDR2236687.1 SMC family ATPase [Chryseobacterium sp.]